MNSVLPPRLARAAPGASEAASAPLPNSKTYRRNLPPALPPSAGVDEGEVFSDLLMSLEQTVAPGVTRQAHANQRPATTRYAASWLGLLGVVDQGVELVEDPQGSDGSRELAPGWAGRTHHWWRQASARRDVGTRSSARSVNWRAG